MRSSSTKIGFIDAGSGGELKAPWKYLPSDCVNSIEFEPTVLTDSDLPLCISNRSRHETFFVAQDERSSSLHEPSPYFVERFGFQSMNAIREIDVKCTTLDEQMKGQFEKVDAIDLNLEGHDFQALQGASKLLQSGFVKLIKIEFELTEVWKGQGWFSDIDPFLRKNQYRLVSIEIESTPPAHVRHIHHKGEPLWGKGYYVPGPDLWEKWFARHAISNNRFMEDQVIKAVSLFVAADLLAQAFDVLDLANTSLGTDKICASEVKHDIDRVFRWTRIDAGLYQLIRLTRGVLKTFSPKNRR